MNIQSQQQQPPEMEKGSSAVSDLLSLNELSYKLESDLSVATSKSIVYQPFLRSEYNSLNNNVAKCVLNTGSLFLKECHLSFTITPRNVDTSKLFCESGTDLIQSICLISRDGSEVERIRESAQLSKYLNKYVYHRSNGPYSLTESAWSFQYDASGAVTFNIPMGRLSGLFLYGEEKCLPSFLCSGLSIEIEFADAKHAFKATEPSAITGAFYYDVSNLEIVCNAYTLSSSVLLALEKNAAQGLEIPFASYQNFTIDASGSQTNLEIRKAVSRGLSLYMATYNVNDNEEYNDTYDPNTFPYEELFVRIGSHYLPSQPITKPATAYSLTYDCMKKINPITCEDSGGHFYSFPLIAIDLERSSIFSFPGVSLNASRIAVVSARFKQTHTNRMMSCFLKYAKLAKIFLNNTSILE